MTSHVIVSKLEPSFLEPDNEAYSSVLKPPANSTISVIDTKPPPANSMVSVDEDYTTSPQKYNQDASPPAVFVSHPAPTEFKDQSSSVAKTSRANKPEQEQKARTDDKYTDTNCCAKCSLM